MNDRDCERKCRLLPHSAFLKQYHGDAFFSDLLNTREHAENKLATCKTSHGIFEKENTATFAEVSGVKDSLRLIFSFIDYIAVFPVLATQWGVLA